MERSKTFQYITIVSYNIIILFIISLMISVNGQISTPCTVSMITSYTPCLNFITGSSSNGSAAPTAGCCGSLKSLMSSGTDCACLLITANVPIQLPINRTLALSLPRLCGMNSVPIQCKSAGTPLPAPGPAFLAPSPPPIADSPFSPEASEVYPASAIAPGPDQSSEATAELTPAASPAPSPSPSPPIESEGPTKTGGIRPVLTPPASTSTSLSNYVVPSISLVQIIIATVVFMFYY